MSLTEDNLSSLQREVDAATSDERKSSSSGERKSSSSSSTSSDGSERELRNAMNSWANKNKASLATKRSPTTLICKRRTDSKCLASDILGPLLVSSGISEDSNPSVDEPMNFIKACKHNDANTVELYGCTFKDTKNKRGLPVIQICINSGAYAVIEKLLQWGVNTSKEGCNGMTALHAAVNVQDIRAATLLLQYGANVNARSSHDQSTPLHIAAKINRADLVRLLLQNGADPTLRNSQSEVPSKFALANYVVYKGKGKRSESSIAILQLLEESLLSQRQQRRPLRRKLGSLLTSMRSRSTSPIVRIPPQQSYSTAAVDAAITMSTIMTVD
eukprot:TRINITY_DN10427_c0_g1_i1.p1 TRINITY_DN10427_c0_g1~~TRINITY_DN10427_c0_g1_i1.p1  ORF type:complete len:330 (+),score=54.70 TRINITY_DN10427_c0_g1_i1:117-1106(+)